MTTPRTSSRALRRRCAVCGGPVESKARGPAPTYCSTPCRRAREYELKRLQVRLGRLEEEHDQARVRVAEFTAHPPMGTKVLPKARARLEELELLIAEERARLLELLANPEEDPR
jgi:hypothetical protein